MPAKNANRGHNLHDCRYKVHRLFPYFLTCLVDMAGLQGLLCRV